MCLHSARVDALKRESAAKKGEAHGEGEMNEEDVKEVENEAQRLKDRID